MFGLFSNKNKPAISLEEKNWVEDTFTWFIEIFGLERVRQHPFILPTHENFPYTNVHDPVQFEALFIKVCEAFHLVRDEIRVKLFDDIHTKQWTVIEPSGPTNEPMGLFQNGYAENGKRFRVDIAKSNLDNPSLLTYVLAHELAHVRLLGDKMVDHNDPDMERITELAVIYFGFGIFMANNSLITTERSSQVTSVSRMHRVGYLSIPLLSYANALLCYISGKDPQSFYPLLNSNTGSIFRQFSETLAAKNKTNLTEKSISNSERRFQLNASMTEGFKVRNFSQVKESCNQYIDSYGESCHLFNNMGYALMCEHNYTEAIKWFTKAIDLDPYWAYPYNNRGYSKLQLGDFDNALADIESALEMYTDNSFAYRNIGVYHYLKNDFEKALKFFTDAYQMDPKTELINFYLGKTYLALNQQAEAQKYLADSAALDEFNDSCIR